MLNQQFRQSLRHSYVHHSSVALFFLIGLLSITSCISLITPTVNTEITQLKKGQYRIDKSHIALIFKVEHLGLSTFVGRFNQVDATLDFDSKNLAATRLSATINTGSVDVNNSELEKTLSNSSWFNVRQYPEARFETLTVEIQTDNTFKFIGALTLRGITVPVTLNAKFNGGADNILTGYYTLGFSATAQLNRTQFGMDSYVGLVGEHVQLEIYAEFLRQ